MNRWLLALFMIASLCFGCSSSDKTEAPSKSDLPQPPSATPAGGMDLSRVNVCQLISKEEVASVFGPVRDEPKEDPPSGQDKGCTYYNQEGHFVDIILKSLEDWNSILQLNGNAKPIPDIGGYHAYSASKPDSLEVWVLREGKAVINIRDSVQDADQAKKFAELTLKILGK